MSLVAWQMILLFGIPITALLVCIVILIRIYIKEHIKK